MENQVGSSFSAGREQQLAELLQKEALLLRHKQEAGLALEKLSERLLEVRRLLFCLEHKVQVGCEVLIVNGYEQRVEQTVRLVGIEVRHGITVLSINRKLINGKYSGKVAELMLFKGAQITRVNGPS